MSLPTFPGSGDPGPSSHEKTESTDREKQEDANKAATASPSPAPQ